MSFSKKLQFFFFCSCMISVSAQHPHSPYERIVTVINAQGEHLDNRYIEPNPGFNFYTVSAPGCPKSTDSIPWLYFTGKNHETRCFLVFTRGPCQPNQYFFPQIGTNSAFGTCIGADDAKSTGREISNPSTSYYSSGGGDAGYSFAKGISFNPCDNGKKLSNVLGKCVPDLSLTLKNSIG